MISTVEQLKSILRELPRRERAEIARFLLESLDEPDSPAPNHITEKDLEDRLKHRLEETLAGAPVNEPIEEALPRLQRLLDRRLDEIVSGNAEGIPAFEAVERLRRKFS